MGSMWPWRALSPVGNAQRPWLPGPAPGGLPPAAKGIAGMGAKLPVRPGEPSGHWSALAFWAWPGSDKSYNALEGNR
jgi:hypothetical protein